MANEELIESLRNKWSKINPNNPQDWYAVVLYGNDAMCVAFKEANCSGCPVKTKTGMGDCKGTPLEELKLRLANFPNESDSFQAKARIKELITEHYQWLVALLQEL